ncbi:hypothetical protein EDF46_2509 [Frondihabitans sp. PhB188]|nr:hypothetical protein EDF46_2509 [Frondihabitans sp. PhB188]
MLQAGDLFELDDGIVFRHPAYAMRYDDFDRAAWFYVNPGSFMEERLDAERTPMEVLSGERALSIRQEATSGGPIVFACQELPFYCNPDYAFVERPIRAGEWEWYRGVAITTPAFAIADMILCNQDEDSIHRALIEVIPKNDFPVLRFLELIEPAAAAWGHQSNDSKALFMNLLRLDIVSHRASGGSILIQIIHNALEVTSTTPLSTEPNGTW